MFTKSSTCVQYVFDMVDGLSKGLKVNLVGLLNVDQNITHRIKSEFDFQCQIRYLNPRKKLARLLRAGVLEMTKVL